MTSPHHLSQREMEVALLLARGQSTKTVAAGLGISNRTVEGYSTTILKKLKLENRVQLAHWALQAGWISNIYKDWVK